ncbi:hypothetical protein SCALM49S_08279 [Streptomyces californicus]
MEVTVRADQHAPWHPGRCAALYVTVNGEETLFGHAGELHPRVIKALHLPERTCAAEVELDVLERAVDGALQAPRISTFPVATQDVALVVAEDVPAADVERALREGAGELLESLRLFDVFTGEQIGGATSPCLRAALPPPTHADRRGGVGRPRQRGGPGRRAHGRGAARGVPLGIEKGRIRPPDTPLPCPPGGGGPHTGSGSGNREERGSGRHPPAASFVVGQWAVRSGRRPRCLGVSGRAAVRTARVRVVTVTRGPTTRPPLARIHSTDPGDLRADHHVIPFTPRVLSTTDPHHHAQFTHPPPPHASGTETGAEGAALSGFVERATALWRWTNSTAPAWPPCPPSRGPAR